MTVFKEVYEKIQVGNLRGAAMELHMLTGKTYEESLSEVYKIDRERKKHERRTNKTRNTKVD